MDELLANGGEGVEREKSIRQTEEIVRRQKTGDDGEEMAAGRQK